MPTLRQTLTELEPDHRSTEKSFTLRIENLTDGVVDIRDVVPLVPEGAVVAVESDATTASIKRKHEDVCESLTRLLSSYLFTRSEALRSEAARIQRAFVKEVLAPWPLFSAYFTLMQSVVRKTEKAQRLVDGLTMQIDSSFDCNTALDTFLSDEDADPMVKRLFEAKYKKLKELELRLGNDRDSTAVATLEPGAGLEFSYTARFSRRELETQRHSFSVTTTYSIENGEPLTMSESRVLAISPRPWILTMSTMIAAYFGVALRFLAPTDGAVPSMPALIDHMSGSAPIAALILAPVVFNVFEHFSFGTEALNKMRINWRSALLVGGLCGLVQGRLVSALMGLIG
jgi:hypothetical protein